MSVVEFVKLNPKAFTPSKSTEDAAGFDLRIIEKVTIKPRERLITKLGLSFHIPPGYYGQISSRSGFAFKNNFTVFHGIVDSDFRGEVSLLLQNFNNFLEIEFDIGSRVAQLLIIPTHASQTMTEVTSLSESVRDSGGFGSTGII